MINPLRLAQLSVSVGGKILADKVNFTFFGGKIYRITGDNGTGKSSLLSAISGFIDTQKFKISGEVFIGESPINELYPKEKVEKFGLVFSPVTNALIGQKVEDELSFALFNLKKSYEYVERKVLDVMDKLGITYLYGRLTNKLSTGQTALVSLAAALAMDADYYLLDEVFGALDDNSLAKAIATIKEEKAKGKVIIFVNHALPDGLSPDITLTLEGGKLCV